MPVIAALISLIGAAVYWWFLLRRAGSAAGAIIDGAERVRGLYRRRRFLKKAGESPIAAVDDPAVAAVILLIMLGKPVDPIVEAAIKAEMRSVMALPNADEAFIFAQWAAGHASDVNAISFRFATLWKRTLNATERADLLAMANRVTLAHGKATAEQIAALRLLRDRLGLTQPG